MSLDTEHRTVAEEMTYTPAIPAVGKDQLILVTYIISTLNYGMKAAPNACFSTLSVYNI
jgi:hypothetical protein